MKGLPLLLTSMSGSLGGLTFSHNRGGAYVRNRANPTQPNTPQQAFVKAIFGALSTRWSAVLTASQRAAWDAYAAGTPLTDRLGQAFFPTGLNMYARGNTGLLQAGGSLVDNGPVTLGLPTLSSVGASSLSTATEIASITFDPLDPWANQTGAHLLIYTSRPQKPSTNFFKGPFRFAGKIDGDDTTPPTSPASITVQFPTTATDVVFFRATAIDAQGRKSSDQFFSVAAA